MVEKTGAGQRNLRECFSARLFALEIYRRVRLYRFSLYRAECTGEESGKLEPRLTLVKLSPAIEGDEGMGIRWW
jgi:hypothetical protein